MRLRIVNWLKSANELVEVLCKRRLEPSSNLSAGFETMLVDAALADEEDEQSTALLF